MFRSPFIRPAVLAAFLSACSEPSPTAPDATLPSLAGGANLTVQSVTVVMQGLDSPRGLAWGPEGALYVVEAGNASVTTNCLMTPRGLSCFSGTGALTRLRNGVQERVVSGLPSMYLASMADIGGPHDVSFQGRGNAWVSIGWGGPPALRATLGAQGAGLGHLIRVQPSGGWSIEADIAGFEGANNPDGGPVDSNPYGVLAEPGRQFVTDAGGNSLLEVTANGAVSLVATFPRSAAPPPFMQSEPVPTEVKRGPDGALYVSTLTGVPFLAGSAAIWRVVPGAVPTVHAGGFKAITDFDIGPDGTMYVLQYASAPVFFGGPGLLIRVNPDGTRDVLHGALTNPTGVLVAPDGAIYVSNRGNLPAVGEVLRIVP